MSIAPTSEKRRMNGKTPWLQLGLALAAILVTWGTLRQIVAQNTTDIAKIQADTTAQWEATTETRVRLQVLEATAARNVDAIESLRQTMMTYISGQSESDAAVRERLARIEAKLDQVLASQKSTSP